MNKIAIFRLIGLLPLLSYSICICIQGDEKDCKVFKGDSMNQNKQRTPNKHGSAK